MTMEKYTQSDDLLHQNLLNEEAQLMQTVQRFMGITELSGEEQAQFQSAQSRLSLVRAKITEIDLKRMGQNRVQESGE